MKKIPCKLFHCRNAFQRFRRLRLTEYQQPRKRLCRFFFRRVPIDPHAFFLMIAQKNIFGNGNIRY